METDLRNWERRVAARLPRTGSMLAVWNSRHWRTTETRRETFFHAALLLIVIVIIVPSIFALARTSRPYPIAPNGITMGLCLALLLLLGAAHGMQIIANSANRVAEHWVASILTPTHVRNEQTFAVILHGTKLAAVLGVICLVIVTMTDLDQETAQMIGLACVVGYAAGCALQVRALGPRTLLKQCPYSQRLRSALPPSMQLQANRPIALLASVVITITLPLALAVVAAASDREGPLIASVVMAVAGHLFCVAQLVPGSAILHRLLSWTGPLSQGALGRLLLLPFLLALAHALPALFASIYLGNHLIFLVALTGIAASVVAFLIRIVGDLRVSRGSSAARISIPQAILLGLIMALGPLGWMFLVWQAIWLGKRARYLWKNPA